MNRLHAMQTIEYLLQDFKYLFIREKLNITELHLTFKMDSDTHELQSSFDFQDKWVDILTFISPTALIVGSEEYYEALKIINHINWHVKSNGRFYVDTYGDIAYSLRIKYDFLETEPKMVISEIETAVEYYADMFIPLLDVCFGKRTFIDARKFIGDMWRES